MRKTKLDPDLVDISRYNKFWLELFLVLERAVTPLTKQANSFTLWTSNQVLTGLKSQPKFCLTMRYIWLIKIPLNFARISLSRFVHLLFFGEWVIWNFYSDLPLIRSPQNWHICWQLPCLSCGMVNVISFDHKLGATNARGVGRERRGNLRGGCMSKLCVQ